MVKKVILIVGLPGSGKSKLGNQLVEDIEDSVFYDEITEHPEEQESVKKACDEYETLILSSPFLCTECGRENIKKFFKEINRKVKLEWKYFDYDVKTCVENKPMSKRKIFEIAQCYTIPNRTKKIKVENYE